MEKSLIHILFFIFFNIVFCSIETIVMKDMDLNNNLNKELEYIDKNKIFEKERDILLKEYENKNAEILNLIKYQKELEQRVNDVQKKSLKESIGEADNHINDTPKGKNSTHFSNFDLNKFRDKVKIYGERVIRKKNINSNNDTKFNSDHSESLHKILYSDYFNNYYLNKKQQYDINNRLNLFDIYLNIDYKKNLYLNLNTTNSTGTSLQDLFSPEPITFYEIFNFKSITKNENGLMQNQLILIAKNDTLLAYDIYLNPLGSARFNEKIVSLKTFKNQEESYVYVLFQTLDSSSNEHKSSYNLKKIKLVIDSSNYFNRRKMYNKLISDNSQIKDNTEFSSGKSDKNNHNNKYPEDIYDQYNNNQDEESDSSFDDSDTIVIRNFKENLGTYTISKSHKKHLERSKIYFELEQEISFINTNILNFKFHISKSIKYIILVIENFKTDEDKKIVKNEIEIKYFNEELKLINSFSFKNEEDLNNPLSTRNEQNYAKRITDIFLNFKIFYNFVYTQFEHSIKISHIETFDKFLLTCDFKSLLAKSIVGDYNNQKQVFYKKYIFTYDQINNYLILITEDLDMMVYYPIVKSTNVKNKNFNVCNFRKLFKHHDLKNILGITHDLLIKGHSDSETKLDLNLINIEIIRSDLLINFNQLGKIVAINLDKFEDHIEENFFEFRVINTNNFAIVNDNLNILNLENTDKKPLNYKRDDYKRDRNAPMIYSRNPRMGSEIVFSKNTFSNFILIQNYENPNIIMIYEVFNPHSKLVGGDYSFLNFKIPIIFVAMIIIFFYHFFKKKNELNEETPEMKKEVFRYLEDQGAFNKKNYKEENEKPIDSKIRSIVNNTNINYSLDKENDINLNSNADESLNDSGEENDSDRKKDEDEYKKKIMEFLKKKN